MKQFLCRRKAKPTPRHNIWLKISAKGHQFLTYARLSSRTIWCSKSWHNISIKCTFNNVISIKNPNWKTLTLSLNRVICTVGAKSFWFKFKQLHRDFSWLLLTQWLFLKQDILPGKWSKSVYFPEIHSFMTAHEHISLLIDVVFIQGNR